MSEKGERSMLLKDDQIEPLVDGANPIILGITKPANWYSEESPLQASSIDLRIGRIFLPESKKDGPGGEGAPLDQHILRPGRTAAVTTLEELKLPRNMAAIGFPPSRVSFQGILMTNPGHVDPGYQGPMRFTVINMGSQDYVLRKSDAIVTLLLLRLSGEAKVDWLARRNGRPGGQPTQKDFDRLSADFLDVDRRATAIASEAVNKAELQIKRAQIRVPIYAAVASIIIGLLTVASTLIKPAWVEPLQQVKESIAELKATRDVDGLRRRVQELEELMRKTIPATERKP
jgi:deoxycytidine triphosphate deaminase